MTHTPELLADYGDGILHWFGWYGPRSVKLQVTRCRGMDDQRPQMLYLPKRAPAVEHCSYCVAGEKKPRSTGRQTFVREGMVPNAPIREAFEASGLTLSELALRMGLVRKVRYRRANGTYLHTSGAETSRLGRMLGINQSHRWRNGEGVKQLNINRTNAVKVLRGLHLDPRDFDL